MFDIDSALGTFGLTRFRPGQREVITAVLNGRDCLCVMPTGGGKSLCYQLPAVVRDGLTIVVSPLIALMKDQVDGLCKRGIAATLINSSLTAAEQSERLTQMSRGAYRLVYIAPERLRNTRFLDAIRATPISLLAVDEAHCISEWGHDFRPDYARLGKFREALGMVQTIALTATATEKVRNDIAKILNLSNPDRFVTGFARSNLHFGCVTCSGEREKQKELIDYLRQQQGAGIVYAATRKRCEAVVELIQNELPAMKADVYHAGLSNDQRKLIQDQFMRDQLKVIVATNAFGMGIDKPDLRYVVHYNLPGTLEAYYQEAGRAGRDGKPSACVLLYSSQDRYIQEFFIENANPPKELVQKVYEFLCDQQEDPIELTAEMIRDKISTQMSSEAVNTAVQILSKTNVLERFEVGGGLAMVRIDSTLPSLVDLLPKESKTRRRVLRAVEKIIGDRREEPVFFHLRYLMQHTELEREALTRALNELRKLEAFDYVPPFRGRAIHFRRVGVPFDELKIDFTALEERKKDDYAKLDRVITFARATQCRQLGILEYFGEVNGAACGGCDRCQGQMGWPNVSLSASVCSNTDRDDATQLDPPSEAIVETTKRILSVIGKLHGRIGKLLIADFLAGSESAKVKSLRLQRLPEFGLLSDLKKKQIVAVLDAMLQTALLEQREVNANRPTVFLATAGEAIISGARLPAALVDALDSTSNKKSARSRTIAPSSETRPNPVATATAKEMGAAILQPTREIDSEDSDTALSEDQYSPLSKTENNREVGIPDVDVLMQSPRQNADPEDWKWTAKLVERGFSLVEASRIRRLAVAEIIHDLMKAQREVSLQLPDHFFDRRTESAIQAFQSSGSRSNQTLIRIDGQEVLLKYLASLREGQLRQKSAATL